MREFRTIKRCKKPRKEQALIYYTCINYHKADKKTRNKIDRLCAAAGGAYADALRDLLIHADTVTTEGIAIKHYCSPGTLWTARIRFFNMW